MINIFKGDQMRLKEIKHEWRSWQPGADNTDANMDIPIEESVDMENLTPTMKSILSMRDNDWGPAMTVEEARAWLKTM
jgi:hypothetical protein